MGKIINFYSKKDNVENFLKSVKKYVKEDNAENLLVAYKCKNEEGSTIVMTGYCNLDNSEKQELLGHIQMDIVKKMIDETYLVD